MNIKLKEVMDKEESACVLSWIQLCNPVDSSLPGCSVHESFQARLLGWVARLYYKGSSWIREQIRIFCLGRRILYRWATWAAHDPLINVSKWINGNFALQPSENLAPVCETDRLPDGEKLWGWIFTRTPINLSLSYWNKRLWHPTNFINT